MKKLFLLLIPLILTGCMTKIKYTKTTDPKTGIITEDYDYQSPIPPFSNGIGKTVNLPFANPSVNAVGTPGK